MFEEISIFFNAVYLFQMKVCSHVQGIKLNVIKLNGNKDKTIKYG